MAAERFSYVLQCRTLYQHSIQVYFHRRRPSIGRPAIDKSFAKGLALLETLARSGRLRGVTDLARELDLQKSNAHRLLQTLVAQGFARQDPDSGRYGASVKVWELGMLVLSRLEIRDHAEPWLAALGRRCGETVNLSIRDGAHVLFIDRLEQGQPTRAGYIGVRAPAHALATGKVLLAHAPIEVQQMAMERLQAFTRKTITDPDALAKNLALIRTRGYALNRGEWREMVNSVAMPVRDGRGEVVAAVGITGPTGRMTAGRIRQLLPDLLEAARMISTRLGARMVAAPVCREPAEPQGSLGASLPNRRGVAVAVSRAPRRPARRSATSSAG
jgi:DNA-binding IclR family transcriptional regulator